MCKLGTLCIDYSFLLSNNLSLARYSVFLLHFFTLLLASLSHAISRPVERCARLLIAEFFNNKVEVCVEGGWLVKVSNLALVHPGAEIGTLLLFDVSLRYIGLASNEVAVAFGLHVHATQGEERIVIF